MVLFPFFFGFTFAPRDAGNDTPAGTGLLKGYFYWRRLEEVDRFATVYFLLAPYGIAQY